MGNLLWRLACLNVTWSLSLLSALQESTAREQEMISRIQKEQEDNMSEMDKAKELLKMKTVKIQRASRAEVVL